MLKPIALATGVAAGLAAVIAVAPPASALTNGGFETGNFSGWHVDGNINAGVVTSFFHNGLGVGTTRTYLPVEGKFFAELDGKVPMQLLGLSQTLFLSKGATLSGAAAFATDDFPPFGDFGQVTIGQGGAGTTLFFSNIAMVGAFGSTPWTAFSFTAPSAGVYTLRAQEFEGDSDAELTSQLLLDAVSVAGGVPELGSWAMMIIGFALASLRLRRRNRALGAAA